MEALTATIKLQRPFCFYLPVHTLDSLKSTSEIWRHMWWNSIQIAAMTVLQAERLFDDTIYSRIQYYVRSSNVPSLHKHLNTEVLTIQCTSNIP